jgi:hypothetical protein
MEVTWQGICYNPSLFFYLVYLQLGVFINAFKSLPVCCRSSGMSVCAGCNESLGYGRFLSCLGKNWHPNCFCCKLCSKPIADREVLAGVFLSDLVS